MPSTTGSSRKRHLRELEVLDIASGRLSDPHANECEGCRSKVERLRRTLDLIGDIDKPASTPFSPSLPESVARAIAQVESGEALGSELVEIAENGTPSELSMRALAARADELSNGLLYACQLGMKLGVRAPEKALRLAEFIQIVAWGLRPGSAISARLIRAEASLLESQGLLFMGKAVQAIAKARHAKRELAAMKCPLLLVARARYYLGTALAFNMDTDEALDSLHEARRSFIVQGEDSWIGRAEAAIAIAIDKASGSLDALRWYDSALERLDKEADAGTIASTQMNRALLLILHGRVEESRRGFSESLSTALSCGARPVALLARINLLGLALEEGAYRETLEKAQRLLELVRSEGRLIHVREATLILAEAHAGLGHYATARRLIETLDDETEVTSGLNTVDVELTSWLRHVRGIALGWVEEHGSAAGSQA